MDLRCSKSIGPDLRTRIPNAQNSRFCDPTELNHRIAYRRNKAQPFKPLILDSDFNTMDSTAKFPPGYLEQYSGNPMVAATVAILVIATILCGLRAWVRVFLTKVKGWDDYLLLPAWLFLIGLGVTTLSKFQATDIRSLGLSKLMF